VCTGKGDKILKIGTLGSGRIRQILARSIRVMDNATVVAVSDAFPKAAQAPTQLIGAEVRSTEEQFNSSRRRSQDRAFGVS